MGARVKTISDEMLLQSGVHALDPELLITTSQAAMLLGCALSGMAERKRSGRPPPARQPEGRGTKVSYQLGDVLAARRAPPAPSNAMAKRTQQDHIRGFPTFAGFLSEGRLTDEWPCAVISGRPVDLFTSLTWPLAEAPECRWFSLEDYLDALKRAVVIEGADRSKQVLDGRTSPALGDAGEARRL